MSLPVPHQNHHMQDKNHGIKGKAINTLAEFLCLSTLVVPGALVLNFRSRSFIKL